MFLSVQAYGLRTEGVHRDRVFFGVRLLALGLKGILSMGGGIFGG